MALYYLYAFMAYGRPCYIGVTSAAKIGRQLSPEHVAAQALGLRP